MDYLFVDIECANNYRNIAKICTFGYVLVDFNLKIKTKEDIIINPESSFNKHIINKKMNAYPISVYEKKPAFPYFYKSIKQLLENKEHIVIGWAIDGDIKYIIDTCKRYKLPLINCKIVDLQKILMDEYQLKTQPSLEFTCDFFKIVKSTLHKSDDDAYMTMQIAMKICQKNNCNLKTILNKYSKYSFTINEFNKKNLHKKSNNHTKRKVKA